MPLQVAKKKVKGVPDIVFCLDVTGSMQPCIDKLKESIGRFIEDLTAPMEQDGAEFRVADWRARVLPYRDLTCDAPDEAMIEDFPFVTTAEELRAQLSDPRVRATGGGDEPESTLDAIYRAAKNSPWRAPGAAHRFVVVFSDATTNRELHESTVGGGMPGDLQEVRQVLRNQRVKSIVFAPRTPEYESVIKVRPELEKASRLFESYSEAVDFYQKADTRFDALMKGLAASVSQSSSEVVL